MMPERRKCVSIRYRNWKGEISWRGIVPLGPIEFKSTPWHEEEQYILETFDLSKGANRSFAVKDILAWVPFGEKPNEQEVSDKYPPLPEGHYLMVRAHYRWVRRPEKDHFDYGPFFDWALAGQCVARLSGRRDVVIAYIIDPVELKKQKKPREYNDFLKDLFQEASEHHEPQSPSAPQNDDCRSTGSADPSYGKGSDYSES